MLWSVLGETLQKVLTNVNEQKKKITIKDSVLMVLTAVLHTIFFSFLFLFVFIIIWAKPACRDELTEK